MHFLWLVGKMILVLIATSAVAHELYVNRDRMDFVWSVWKRFRPLMFVEVLVALVLTITVVVTLWTYVPLLRWGWLNFFISGGGNIIFAPVAEGSKSSNMLVRMLPPIFFIALLVAFPFLAHYEEEKYRRGYHDWNEIARQSVKFGLAHLWVGIPLAAGVGLILPGFFFAWKYRSVLNNEIGSEVRSQIQDIKEKAQAMGIKGKIRVEAGPEQENEAVMVSTAYHTLYNSLLVLLLLVLAVVAI